MDDEDLLDSVHRQHLEAPTTLELINSILRNYPDNGQILKELVQNADDAGATTVKFLVDEHTYNSDSVLFDGLKKYQGPSLLVYNDAVLSDTDWCGLLDVYKSNKGEDPLKIGKFGLGFKSSFHITDLISCISGNEIGFLDPHENIFTDKNRPYAKAYSITPKISAVYKRGAFDQIAPFEKSIFGLGNGELRQGRFNGTIFRLPLRQEEHDSKIETNRSYSEKKILGLFEGMRKDGHLYLLFLKNIEKLEFYHRPAGSNEPKKVFSVGVSPNDLECLREERAKFYKSLNPNSTQPLTCGFRVAFEILQGSTALEAKYLVQLRYHVASQNVKRLMAQSKQPPLVGVALPLSQPPPEENELLPAGYGHLFCYLPLPIEEQILTGLGVHVNGAFSVSPNRKNIKLPTKEDQREKIIKLRFRCTGENNLYFVRYQNNRADIEEEIQWNKALIKEVIPKCLADLTKAASKLWLQGAVEKNQVMRIFPLEEKLVSLWKQLRDPYHDLIRNECIVVAKTNDNGGKSLVKLSETYFISIKDARKIINQTVLMQSGIQSTMGTEEVILDLTKAGLIRTKEQTDDRVVNGLKTLGTSLSLSSKDKTDLLKWLLLKRPTDLSKMALLPLQNGKWKVWKTNASTFFYLTNSDKENVLLPSMNSYLVDMKDIPRETWRKCIKKNGPYNVQWFTLDTLASKILNADLKNLDECYLRRIWSYIPDGSLRTFENSRILPTDRGIFPLRRDGRILCQSKHQYSTNVKKVFERLKVTVVADIPSFVTCHPDAKEYFYTHDSLDDLMKKIPDPVLRSCALSASERKEMRELMVHVYVSDMKHKLKLLPLFETVQRSSGGSCAYDSAYGIQFSWPITIPTPPHILDLTDNASRSLSSSLGARSVGRGDFIKAYVFPLTMRPGQRVELFKYCTRHPDLFKDKEILNQLSQLEFLEGNAGGYRTASEYLDPTDCINIALFQEHFSHKFPSLKELADDMHHLRNIGLRSHNDIKATEIVELARYIARVGNETVAKLSTALMEHLQDNLLNEKYSEIAKLPWIVAKAARPTLYPSTLPWLADTKMFGQLKDFVSEDQIDICGSQKLVMRRPPAFFKCKASRNALLTHFMEILDALKENIRPENELLTAYERQLYQITREFAHEEANFLHEMERISSLNCIIVNNRELIPPSKIVVSESGENLQPLLYKLPDRLHFAADFLVLCGAYECVNEEVLVGLIENLQIKYGNDPLSASNLNLVIVILEKLHELRGPNKKYSSAKTMHLPNKRAVLTPVSRLAIDNCPWLDDKSEAEHCHKRIDPDQAQYFGVEKTRNVLINKHSYGIPFGQKEELTNRLKRLLQGYPRESIFKELLQNADDSGATEVRFVFDERSHSTKRVFDDDGKWSSLQGPALLVYNDKPFTADDLKGIKQLGEGSKQDDPMKTGQYGVGFNCVYNLTDTPTFLTTVTGEGRSLVAFDPHCEYVYGATPAEPGRRFMLDGIESKFPDVFAPYEGFDFAKEGTLFRLPLRTAKQAATSQICKKEADPQEVLTLLKRFFECDAEESLLFLQNVKTLAFSRIASSGEHEEIGSATLQLEDACIDKIAHYTSDRWVANKHLREKSMLLDELQYQNECFIAYTTTTVPSRSERKLNKTWYVSLAHGLNGTSSERRRTIATHYAAGSIKLNVNVGLAWSPSMPATKGKLFCLLPFRGSQFSFHMNAHFALNYETRDDLCLPDKGKIGHLWNEEILSSTVAPAHVDLLKYIQKETIRSAELDQYVTKYYKLFPQHQQKEPLDAFVDSFYKLIANERCAFPKVLLKEKDIEDHSIHWISLQNAVFTDHKFWESPVEASPYRRPFFQNEFSSPKSETPNEKKMLAECLLDLGMDLVYAPSSVGKELRRLQLSHNVLDASAIRECVRDCDSLRGTLPCALQLTPIRTKERLEQLYKKGLRDGTGLEDTDIWGLKLFPSKSGNLHAFGQKTLFRSVHSDVVNCPDEFLDPYFIKYFSRSPMDKFCKKFTIIDLERHLPTVLPADIYKIDDEIAVRDLPVQVKAIWDALPDIMSEDEDNSGSMEGVLADWSIYPCKNRKGQLLLVPIRSSRMCVRSNASFLPPALAVSSHRHRSSIDHVLDKILRDCCRLQAYSFDPNSYQYKKDALYKRLLGRPDNPTDVINILLDVEEQHWSTLSKSKDVILSFFSLNQVSVDPELVRKLRTLPLFTLANNKIVALGSRNALCLEGYVPQFTLEFEDNTVILASDEAIRRELLETLGVKIVKPMYVYQHYIIPKFHLLCKEEQHQHLCNLNTVKSHDIENIEQQLKQTKLVQNKMPNFFHDGKNSLLKAFDLDRTLPKEYKDYKKLLLKCGLRVTPTSAELTSFAGQISAYPERFLSDDDLNKTCKEILKHAITASTSLNELVDIDFLPQKAVRLKTMLGESSDTLVSLNNATICSTEEAALCWSQNFIIDKELIPDKMIKDLQHPRCRLGSSIEISEVVAHLKSLSSKLQQAAPNAPDELKNVFIKDIEIIFSWMEEQLSSGVDSKCCQDLSDVPLLLLRDGNMDSLLAPSVFGIETVPLEIPKLMMPKNRLHDKLQQFGPVLRKIGALGQITLKNYLELLNRFPENETIEHPEQQEKIVDPIYKHMIQVLYESWGEGEKLMHFKHLLLPDSNYCMKRSSSMVYVDDKGLLDRVGKDEMQLLRCPKRLVSQMKPALSSLPKHLQPQRLSSFYCEDIANDPKESLDESSEFIYDLERRFADEDFGVALKRLCHANANILDSFVSPPEVKERLQIALSLDIKLVTDLKTKLKRDGTYLDKSERSEKFFLKSSSKGIATLYIDSESEGDRSVQDSIKLRLQALLIEQLEIRDGEIKEHVRKLMVMPLTGIVKFMESKQFTLLEVDARDLPGKLGSRLPKNTRRNFTAVMGTIKNDEYVCVLDESQDLIIGRIKELHSRCEIHPANHIYLVDFGTQGKEIVPGYRICVFHHSQLADRLSEGPEKEITDLMHMRQNDLVPLNDLKLFCYRVSQRIEELQANLEDGEELYAAVKMDVDLAIVKDNAVKYRESFKYRGVFNVTPRTRVRSEVQSVTYTRRKSPNPDMAKAMLDQAKHDLDAVPNDFEGPLKSLCWAASKIHQASEKALKAKLYTVDEIEDDLRRSHNLTQLACATENGSYITLAAIIWSNLGKLVKLQYPFSPRSLPKDKFDHCPETVRSSYERAIELMNIIERDVLAFAAIM